MAASSKDRRLILTLESTARTGYRYITQKNKINTRERIVLMKYDPVIGKHVEFRETR
jgi:large subunit ribosomal protein L33